MTKLLNMTKYIKLASPLRETIKFFLGRTEDTPEPRVPRMMPGLSMTTTDYIRPKTKTTKATIKQIKAKQRRG